MLSVSRVPGPPPRTSTPPRLPGGAITTVQPVAPSAFVQCPIREPVRRADLLAHVAACARSRRRGLRRSRRWQDGQKYVERPPTTIRRISAPQRGHGLPSRRVDQELVLHRALLAARVAVVVDRRAAAAQPRLERLDDAPRSRSQSSGFIDPAGDSG